MEIGENQIKGSTFSDGNCFKDIRLGFASSSDVVEENNESIELAESSCSDSSEIIDDDEDENASSSSSSSKRGLSKCYDGRSQSYTSLLTSGRSLEDLMKKERPYNKRLKLCTN